MSLDRKPLFLSRGMGAWSLKRDDRFLTVGFNRSIMSCRDMTSTQSGV